LNKIVIVFKAFSFSFPIVAIVFCKDVYNNIETYEDILLFDDNIDISNIILETQTIPHKGNMNSIDENSIFQIANIIDHAFDIDSDTESTSTECENVNVLEELTEMIDSNFLNWSPGLIYEVSSILSIKGIEEWLDEDVAIIHEKCVNNTHHNRYVIIRVNDPNNILAYAKCKHVDCFVKKIQRQWRNCISNPEYNVCQKRLVQDWLEINNEFNQMCSLK
jgi:hypothetical protein